MTYNHVLALHISELSRPKRKNLPGSHHQHACTQFAYRGNVANAGDTAIGAREAALVVYGRE